MAFTSKDWRDFPDTTTPITAAALEDLETRLAAYTDSSLTARQANFPIVSVRAYGAVGDGTTDDTAALAAALAAAAGGVLFLPAGVYPTTAALAIPSNTTVRGVGFQSQIKVGGPAHSASSVRGFTSTSTSRVMFESFRLVGPEDGTMTTGHPATNGRGFHFDTVTDFTIRDVHVSNFSDLGIYIGSGVRGKITGCTVKGIYYGDGIACGGTTDMLIQGNNVDTVADCGISTHNGSARTIIDGNTVTDTLIGRGIDIEGAPETVVTNNTLLLVGGTGGGGSGIQVYQGIASQQPSRCLIANNVIVDPHDAGIVLDGSVVSIDDTVIDGNYVRGASTQGIWVSQAATRTQIVGNAVYGCASSGIRVSDSGGRIPVGTNVSGNFCRDNTSWGLIATSNVTSLFASGNSFLNNTAGAVSVPGAATVLYESAAGVLATPGRLNATEGLVTKVVAGAVSDASFTVTPPSGTIAVDTTNSKIYIRVGSTWKAVTVA